MTRECKRNSSLNFIIVLVIAILAVAFTVRAQGTGDGQRLIKPSAVPERGRYSAAVRNAAACW